MIDEEAWYARELPGFKEVIVLHVRVIMVKSLRMTIVIMDGKAGNSEEALTVCSTCAIFEGRKILLLF